MNRLEYLREKYLKAESSASEELELETLLKSKEFSGQENELSSLFSLTRDLKEKELTPMFEERFLETISKGPRAASSNNSFLLWIGGIAASLFFAFIVTIQLNQDSNGGTHLVLNKLDDSDQQELAMQLVRESLIKVSSGLNQGYDELEELKHFHNTKTKIQKDDD